MRKRSRMAYRLTVALLCAAVLVPAVAATRHLEWPPDTDHYRDIAQIQTIRDGALFQDPFYRGESSWYNPLMAATLAAIAAAFNQPVNIVESRAGAYLNLAAVPTFFLLASTLAGRRAALAALIGCLFVIRAPAWASPSYSPSLFASVFAQPFFYLTIWALMKASSGQHVWRYVATGVLLGLTFLGHTAPALVAALTIAVFTVYRAVEERPSVTRLGIEVAAVIVPAVVTSLPVLWSIVGRYRLHIQNLVPLMWKDETLPPDTWTFLASLVTRGGVLLAVIVVGAVAAARGRINRRAAVVMTSWLLSSAVLFWYHQYLVVNVNGQFTWPPAVPAHHFLISGWSAAMMFFGLGVATLTRWAASLASRVVPASTDAEQRPPIERWIYIASAAGIVAVNYPAFLARPDFSGGRQTAQTAHASPELRAIGPWIRAHSNSTDVIFTSESACLSIVGPSGRKCVLAPRFFSNPYVDWNHRQTAYRAMWDALETSNCAGFQSLAAAYRVRYVMTVAERTPKVPAGRCGLVATDFPGENWRIFRAFEW